MKTSSLITTFRTIILFAFIFLYHGMISNNMYAQNVGINNLNPNAKALLDLTSNNKGMLTPRMTSAERLSMFPVPDATSKGMLVYQTNGVEGFYYYDGSIWNYLSTDKSSWSLNGNAGTDPSTNFLGTTDSVPLLLRTNNIQAMRINADGKVSINYNASLTQLFVRSADANSAVSSIQNTNATGFSEEQFFGNDNQLKAYAGYANPGVGSVPNTFFTGTYASIPYILATSNAERMRITNAGNIGIGTANPAGKVHVYADSYTGFQNLKISEKGNDFCRIGMYNDSTANFFETTASPNNVDTLAYYHVFYNTKGNLLTIKGDGKVGIGNNNPAAQLSLPSSVGNKITLYGTYGHMYGFGIQSSLMQLFVPNANGDFAFGHGSSDLFTEIVRIKGNGNVGIGTSSPLYRLHMVSNTMVVPMAIQNTLTNGYSGMHFLNNAGSLVGHVGYANASAATFSNSVYSGSIAAIPYILTTSDLERVRIDAAGNVGIGNSNPTMPLCFNNNVGGKISFWNSGSTNYGIGLQAALLQIHTASVFDDVAFGFGSSSAFTETMRIKGNGNVGIGTSTPTTDLEVNGFTKLGSTAPAIKVLKLTGTTATFQGGAVSIPHTVSITKIVSVQVLVEKTATTLIPAANTIIAGDEFNFQVTTSVISITNKTGNSANILSKPIRIIVTYEE